MSKFRIIAISVIAAVAIAAGIFAYSAFCIPAASGQDGSADAATENASSNTAEKSVSERFTVEGNPKGVDSHLEMITDTETGHRYLVYIEAGRSSMVEIDDNPVTGWGTETEPYGIYKVDGVVAGDDGVMRFVYTNSQDSMQYSCAPEAFTVSYDGNKDMFITVYKFGNESTEDAWRWPAPYGWTQSGLTASEQE